MNEANEVEAFFAGPYREKWNRIYKEGYDAGEQGVPRSKNPHKLKVWKAAWDYGWYGINPMFTWSKD